MNPNALSVDPTTGAIVLPVGGTGSFIAHIVQGEGVEIDPQNAIVIFAVSDMRWVGTQQHRAEIIKKELDILTNEEDGLYVQVNLENADTRNLKPDTYCWDLTLVTDPERDEEGNVIVEDSGDNVIPIFARSGSLPKFTLCEVTVIV